MGKESETPKCYRHVHPSATQSAWSHCQRTNKHVHSSQSVVRSAVPCRWKACISHAFRICAEIHVRHVKTPKTPPMLPLPHKVHACSHTAGISHEHGQVRQMLERPHVPLHGLHPPCHHRRPSQVCRLCACIAPCSNTNRSAHTPAKLVPAVLGLHAC